MSKTKKKVSSAVYPGQFPAPFPPINFLLLRAPKLAAIARYCSRSLKRAQAESMAAGFIVPLMERLIPDRDPTDLFLCFSFFENGGPLRGC